MVLPGVNAQRLTSFEDTEKSNKTDDNADGKGDHPTTTNKKKATKDVSLPKIIEGVATIRIDPLSSKDIGLPAG